MLSVGVLQAVLKVKNLATPELKKAARDVTVTGQQVRAAGTHFLSVSALILGLGAASTSFAADFDSAMTKSIAIMGDLGARTDDEFARIKGRMETTARDVAKTTTFSARQAAESYFFLASAGLDAQTSVKALPQVAQFAQAGLFDMARATDLLTDAQSALGLTVRDAATGAINTTATMANMARVSDVLVKANTLANASVEQFSQSLTTKAGAALKIVGKDIEEGVAVLAAFADQGVKAQDSGTGLSIVLRDLSTKAIKNAEKFRETGVAVFDAAGNMNNIGAIIKDLEVALAGMSDETAKATLLNLGFTDKSVSFIQTLIGMGDQIQRYEAELRKAAGTTKEVADKQLESFSAQMGLLKDKVVDVGIELGGVLIPILLDMAGKVDPVVDSVSSAVKWFGELPGPVQLATVVIAALAAGVPVLAIALGQMVIAGGALMPFLAAAPAALASFAVAAAPIAAALGAVAATAGVAFGVGSELRKIPIVTKAADALADAILGVKRNAEGLVDLRSIAPSPQDLAALERAKKLAGELGVEIPKNVGEAIKFLADYNAKLREKSVEEAQTAAASSAVVTAVAKVRDIAGETAAMVLKLTGASRELGIVLSQVEARAKASLATQIRNAEFQRTLPQAMAKARVEADRLSSANKPFKLITLAAETSKVAVDAVGESFKGITLLVAPFSSAISKAVTAAAGSFAGFKKLFGEGLTGFKDLFRNTEGQFGFGSILKGLAKNLPAIGALAGPIFSGLKKLFSSKPRWEEIAEAGAKQFGQAFSEKLAKALEKSEKALGSLQNATAANIGDIVSEVGVNAKNLEPTLESIGNLIGMVQNGTIEWKDAVDQLDQAFGPVKDQLLSMGDEGLFKLGALVNKMKELGNVSAEVQDFIKEKAGAAVQAFSGFFENLANKENLTAEEAKNALGVVQTAFQAAITAGGGLLGAIQQLGPNFGGIIEQLRGVLGEENAVLNQMTRFYNFVSNNQEQLAAIESLGAGFKELAAIGMVNAANINSFGQTFVDEFNRVLASTDDQNTALAAMGPQIAQLLAAYNELGVAVPPSLQKIAEDAKAAGVSLVPPEGTEDIMKDIRDVLISIGEALGVASGAAKDFGRNLDGINPPSLPTGGDGFVPRGFAQGGIVRARPGGEIIRVAEGGQDEAIIPLGGNGGGASSGSIGAGITVQELKLVVAVEGNILSSDQEVATKLQGPGLHLLEDPRVQKKILDLAERVAGSS